MNYFVAKRLFDYTLSLVGLLMFSPLIILITFLVFIEDGPPIFYVKKTVGIYGKIFKIFKFRSMKKNSLYITKIGKLLRETAMDEIPQLLTIVKGDMSFVGPRPYAIERYGISKEFEGKQIPAQILDSGAKIFMQRLSIRPGLTGLAQLYVPKHADDQEVLKWDLVYLKNKSFLSDLRIIYISIWITAMKKWEKTTRKI